MAGPVIPRSIFDSRGMQPRKAFALWQEQLDHLAEARLATDAEEFQVRSEAAILDRLVLGNTRNTTYFYDRSRFRVARDDVDHYMLHFFRKGRLICRRTGTGETIKPGDMLLADFAVPGSMAVVDLDIVHIVIPRSMLAPLLVEPDAHVVRHFSGDDVLVRLLHNHVSALHAQSGAITIEQARALVPALLEMAAAAINGGVTETTGAGVSATLRQAICRHVCEYAPSAELKPERIAARFSISPRKLSYLFQAEGGIGAYIQSERLRLARAALMDPAQRGRTIAEIAEAHGFAHRTSFIRAFERAYSLTPSQLRALAAERRRSDRAPVQGSSPIRWIGHF